MNLSSVILQLWHGIYLICGFKERALVGSKPARQNQVFNIHCYIFLAFLFSFVQAPRLHEPKDPCPHLPSDGKEYKLQEMTTLDGNKIWCCGCPANHTVEHVCRSNELYATTECKQCPEGYYIPDGIHNKRQCILIPAIPSSSTTSIQRLSTPVPVPSGSVNMRSKVTTTATIETTYITPENHPPETTPGTGEPQSGLSTLEIVFIVLGVIVVLVLVIYFVLRHCRRRDRRASSIPGSNSNEPDGRSRPGSNYNETHLNSRNNGTGALNGTSERNGSRNSDVVPVSSTNEEGSSSDGEEDPLLEQQAASENEEAVPTTRDTSTQTPVLPRNSIADGTGECPPDHIAYIDETENSTVPATPEDADLSDVSHLSDSVPAPDVGPELADASPATDTSCSRLEDEPGIPGDQTTSAAHSSHDSSASSTDLTSSTRVTAKVKVFDANNEPSSAKATPAGETRPKQPIGDDKDSLGKVRKFIAVKLDDLNIIPYENDTKRYARLLDLRENRINTALKKSEGDEVEFLLAIHDTLCNTKGSELSAEKMIAAFKQSGMVLIAEELTIYLNGGKQEESSMDKSS